MKQALELHFYDMSSVMNETPTGVHSDYKAADDEHLKRVGRLTQGHQQSSSYCKAVIDKQGSSPAGRKTMWKRNLRETVLALSLTTIKDKNELD